MLLNAAKAKIFRLVHIQNVPWILDNGLHCPNSALLDPSYIKIGLQSLIEKRAKRIVPCSPGGTLSDYVPFYFTPHSMMMYNIHTGHGEVTKQSNEDLVLFVSNLRFVQSLGLRFLFTTQHANLIETKFYSSLEHLELIDWPLLQQRDFRRNDTDPGKPQRYQAEALIYKHVPLTAIKGIVCFNDSAKERIERWTRDKKLNIPVKALPTCYFEP